jgi:pyridinium-3,5-bisthiocarboxylic acid mononucleotide nickel chelatase
MKCLYLDPFSGVSGDMFLGLLGDLGLDRQALQCELNKLALPGWRIDWRVEQRLGISGTRAAVACQEQSRHRHWREIDTLLAESGLAERASRLARKIFRNLGEAEARVHGQLLEEVHFHEVGALDAIIDVSAAAIGLQLLGVQQLLSAPLPLNRGFVATAHGRLPLPAPAVAALLEGHPVCHGDGDQELVTPTGAAIVVSAAEFSPLPRMTLEKVGYGVGGRDLTERPNLLRGFLGSVSAKTSLDRDEISVLECNLDDANPEWLGLLLEKLLQKGALDVTLAPLLMKKNRPGQLLTALVKPEQEEELARLIMHESSAIGVRSYRSQRYKLQRQSAQVTTPAGRVAVKLIYEGETLLRVTPEFESCRALAEATGLPLPEIYRQVEVAAAPLLERLPKNEGSVE